ncbi:MAG: glutamate formimidoyltransferase [Myxococcales bacterium]|nr:glutamate formimidoyltransferase [Myxococcales bacterium]
MHTNAPTHYIECVPNISEGRRPETIEKLAALLRRDRAVRLLHVDRGADAHRTVFTFVAPASHMVAAAFRFVDAALQCIDMRQHQGIHERAGAVDVVPFVPIGNTPMQRCIDTAHALAERIGAERQLPVYLYGEAARTSQRFHLSDIRRGGYEALAHKLSLPHWRPDAGPANWSEAVARSGSVQIGARPFLIAWNLNLATADARIATRIAQRIRESGTRQHGPGLFRGLKARGWFVPAFSCAQITMNLTDFRASPMHEVFDAASQLAQEAGTRVTGSELIGLVPLAALEAAGRAYLQRRVATTSPTSQECVHAAVAHFNLAEHDAFDPQTRIIEWCLDR